MLYITTNNRHWSGLSGATLKEGKSWSKKTSEGYDQQCFCDATKALPLIVHALHEKVKTRRRESDLSWLLSQPPR
jgi:deoxyhypusine synthase